MINGIETKITLQPHLVITPIEKQSKQDYRVSDDEIQQSAGRNAQLFFIILIY